MDPTRPPPPDEEGPQPNLSKPILLHRNPFLDITHIRADFGTFAKDYYVVTFGPRVGLIVIREECVLLVRQYRLLPGRLCWEVPGGKLEIGEDPAEAAVRECLEETGIRGQNPQPLLVYFPGLDNVENRTSLFVCDTSEEVHPFQPQEREVDSIAWVSLKEALHMVFDGTIQDALSVAGILGYWARRSLSAS